MKKLLAILGLVCLLPFAASAAVVNITAGSGTPFLTFLDGTSNNFSAVGIAGLTATNQADVNSSHQLLVTGPVTQSGTWNVNNISGTVSLPTGASTSANQPTVVAVGGAATSGNGTMDMGAVTTAAPTYTTGQTDPLSLDTAGNLRVNCITGCSASTSITGWAGGTLGAMANYGTSPGAVLVPGVNAFVTNSLASVGNNSDAVAAAAGAASPAVTYNYAFNGTTWDRVQDDANKNVKVAAQAAPSGGWTPLLVNAQSTTVKSVKGTAGQLGYIQCWNPNASVAYVQVFNVVSGSVTLGTTVPVQSYGIAPTSTGGLAMSAVGIQFSTAISLAVTTTATGSTAMSTALDCNVGWN